MVIEGKDIDPAKLPEGIYERDAYIGKHPLSTRVQVRSPTGEIKKERKLAQAGATAVAIGPAADRAYLAWSDGTLSVVALEGSRKPVKVGRVYAEVSVLALSPDGTQLAVQERDGSISVWPIKP